LKEEYPKFFIAKLGKANNAIYLKKPAGVTFCFSQAFKNGIINKHEKF